MNTTEINRGRAALDSVKHCQDVMTKPEVSHDRKMRTTPPNQWTVQDVITQEKTSHRINNN